MELSISNLPTIQEALVRRYSLVVDANDQIAVDGVYDLPFDRFFSWVDRKKELSERVCAFIDRHEGASIETQKRLLDFVTIFQKAHLLISQHALEWRKEALAVRVRYMKILPDEKSVPSNEAMETFLFQAESWLEKSDGIDDRSMDSVRKRELAAIFEVTAWRKLLAVQEMRQLFFHTVLRFRLPPSAFFLFPGLMMLLQRPYLLELLGQESGQINFICSDNPSKPYEACAKLSGRNKVDLLDQNAITPEGPVSLLFEKVSLQDYHVSPWVYFRGEAIQKDFGGIAYFPPNHIWETVDLHRESFWKDLPYHLIDESLFQKRYRLFLQEEEALLSIVSTRRSPKMALTGHHTFLELVLREKRGYRVYPFGFFPENYFQNIADTLETLFGVIKGTWLYPDPNSITREREHIYYAKKLEEGQLRSLWSLFREQFLAAKEGKLLFQLGVWNCATVARKFFNVVMGKKAIPKSWFVVSFSEVDSPPLLGKMAKAIDQYIPLSGLFFSDVYGKTLSPLGKEKKISLALLQNRGLYSSSKLFKSLSSQVND